MLGGDLASDAEGDHRGGGREERVLLDRQEGSDEGSRHAAGPGDRAHQRVAILDPGGPCPIGDVVDRAAGDGGAARSPGDDPGRFARIAG